MAVSVHFSHACFFAVRTRSVLTEKFQVEDEMSSVREAFGGRTGSEPGVSKSYPGLTKRRSLAGLVERAALIPQVKLNLHLRRDPHNSNSELFLLDGLARANHDLPCIVHSIEQHSHFRRPRSKRRGAFLDQRPKLIRRSFGLSHAAGSLIGNVSLAQRNARGRMRSAGGSNRRSRTRSPINHHMLGSPPSEDHSHGCCWR
jgi:hypothetical protein